MGHRLAAKQPVPVGDLRARVEDAVGVLGELGGLAEVEERDGGYVIRSQLPACWHGGAPRAASSAEALLADIADAPVRQTCDTEGLRCRFEVGNAVSERRVDPPPGA